MRNPAPSLEELATERIFSAFNKNYQAARRDSPEVPQSSGETSQHFQLPFLILPPELVSRTSEQEAVRLEEV